MTVRCPYCMSASMLSQEDVGAAGRMVTCKRCGTRWLARVYADDAYQRPAAFAAGAASSGPIEDAVVVEDLSPRARAARLRQSAPEEGRARALRHTPGRQRAFKIVGSVLGIAVALFMLRAPVVSALPVFGAAAGLQRSADALTFNRVRSEVLRIHGVSTLFVDGEVLNGSSAEVDLPAIRVTLKSTAGQTITSWLVEPARQQLDAGESIGFRSAFASPPAEATEVSLALARREGQTVGLN